MAPALTDTNPTPPHFLSEAPAVSKAIFPDGLKTSGQHAPIPERLRPYNDFPREISGQTVWKAEDYQNNPERWIHVFNDEQIDELSKAADDFLASGIPLTGITKDLFPLLTLESFFGTVRKELVNGKGFILFKGIPVQEWSLEKCAVSPSNISYLKRLKHQRFRNVNQCGKFVTYSLTMEDTGSIYGPWIIFRILCEPK